MSEEHAQKTKERLEKLRYEIIDLEQILILLTGLDKRRNETIHM